ncbi:MAG: HAD-IA family hydrolase [Firmicutes bacterium]|nr:HAD-IA family hydrolase [Bacillota bacterium]
MQAALFGAVEAVLFDIDGTLTDTVTAIEESMRMALDEFGWGDLMPCDLRRLIGKPWQEFIPRMHPQDPEGFRRRFMEIAKDVQGARAPFPGIPEALAELKAAGYRMAIVTTKSRTITDYMLEKFALGDYFEVSISADEVRSHKPEPEPVLKAVEALGVAPRRSVMIGDTPMDVLAGRRAGTWTTAVTWGMGSREELAAAGPDFVLESVLDITGLLVPRGGNDFASR